MAEDISGGAAEAGPRGDLKHPAIVSNEPRIAPGAVWNMPLTGVGFACCCGDKPVTEDMVEAFILNLCGRYGQVTHQETLDAARDLWMAGQECEFFAEALSASACRIAGAAGGNYEWEQATAIIGLFSRTWLGCPEAAFDPARSC
ncbi:hypothetical protein LG293_17770 (plasmid) [Citricoccus nitrophenolicus]